MYIFKTCFETIQLKKIHYIVVFNFIASEKKTSKTKYVGDYDEIVKRWTLIPKK